MLPCETLGTWWISQGEMTAVFLILFWWLQREINQRSHFFSVWSFFQPGKNRPKDQKKTGDFPKTNQLSSALKLSQNGFPRQQPNSQDNKNDKFSASSSHQLASAKSGPPTSGFVGFKSRGWKVRFTALGGVRTGGGTGGSVRWRKKKELCWKPESWSQESSWFCHKRIVRYFSNEHRNWSPSKTSLSCLVTYFRKTT